MKNRAAETKKVFLTKSNENIYKVIEVRYNDVDILYNDEIVVAHIKRDLNLVANHVLLPGDNVVVAKENNKYIITNLVERKSLLTRNKKNGSNERSKNVNNDVASNIDIAVIVVSACTPKLHPGFIDRYLLLLENSNIPAIICLNKADLKTSYEEEILSNYRKLNIKVIETSTINNKGINDLSDLIRGKNAILVGLSGVGKSSITNAIMKTNEIRTGAIGGKTKRGKHTTTSSKYYVWDESSSIIDTPGIRSIDLSNFKKYELQDYFKDFDEYKHNCKFKDCLHDKEPINVCAIKQAVKNGFINEHRYKSYVRILSSSKKD